MLNESERQTLDSMDDYIFNMSYHNQIVTVLEGLTELRKGPPCYQLVGRLFGIDRGTVNKHYQSDKLVLVLLATIMSFIQLLI